MENPFETSKPKDSPGKRQGNIFLDADAWLDSQLYELRFRLGEFWERTVIFFRRFRARGFKRALAEITSEGMTLGAGGLVVMLALAIPAADEIDDNWRQHDAFAVTFLDRYGNEIGRRGILQDEGVPISEMPDHLIKAVLATEDRRFYDHFGIDIMGLIRAMTENVRANSIVQGGSTITQQLAKNLFLTPEQSLERKIKEAFLSLWLEQNLTKDEILKLYLDRAYMGGGTFGVTAAAEFYFDKDIRNVTIAEAAMLSGLFKAPTNFAPHINLPAARGRANEVLTNLVQAEFMSEGQVTGARLAPADVVIRQNAETPEYFLDWAFEEVRAFALQQGITDRSLVARTTLDMDLQQATEESVEFHLRQQGSSYRVNQAAAVVLENTGAVRALVGGRDYGESQFNRATSGGRQTGSSFKVYVYAAALEAGLTPSSPVVDAPVTWRGWSPQNYNRRFAGRTTMTEALARSFNTVPVRLARDTLKGTERVVELTKELGVESDVSGHHTTVLGTSNMTVMDQATAYLVFANGGLGDQRHSFTQIMSADGDILYDRNREQRETRRVLTSEVAGYMNEMLVAVTERGTARRAALPGIRAAGKTGTTQAYRDAWFVGYTGNMTAAVWYGNDDYSPTRNLTGGRLPAETWQRIMSYAHQNIELLPMHGVDESIEQDDAAREELLASVTENGTGLQQLSLSADTSDYLRRLHDELAQSLSGDLPNDQIARRAANPTQ